MVAFLRRFPCLDSAEYRRLARGETAPGGEAAPPPDSPGPETSPHAITANCARCYSVNGLGRGLGAFPKLAGQRATYLDLSLRAYARGQRHSGIMQPPCRSTQPGGDARAGALLRKHAGAGGIPAAGGIGNRARQNDRAARHPVSTRPRLRRAEPALSRTGRPVRRLSRASARPFQACAPWRHGLCAHHAPGCRRADCGADARGGAFLRLVDFHHWRGIAVAVGREYSARLAAADDPRTVWTTTCEKARANRAHRNGNTMVL